MGESRNGKKTKGSEEAELYCKESEEPKSKESGGAEEQRMY